MPRCLERRGIAMGGKRICCPPSKGPDPSTLGSRALTLGVVNAEVAASPARLLRPRGADGAGAGDHQGTPDNAKHPYAGELLFYVPDEIDPRFSDPGAWFTCTGTLVDPTHVVTAGHCTYAVGRGGQSTTAGGGTGSGGTDVWISFAEVPDFDILPPSSEFAPDGNADRYAAWSTALDGSEEWVRATSFPHPQFDPDAFCLHDMGVLELSEPVHMSTYGALPSQGLIDKLYQADRNATYTAVGYGLEESSKFTAVGGDNRRDATVKINNLQGVYGTGKGIAVGWSSNNGKPHQGGTCFGDSGGPTFPTGDADSCNDNVVLTVTSFGIDENCAAGGGGYRLDQPDDLAFLSMFGLTPSP